MNFYLNMLICSIIQDYFKNMCVTNIYEDRGISIQNHTMILFQANYSNINKVLFKKNDTCQNFVVNSMDASKTFMMIEHHLITETVIRYQKRKYIVVTNEELDTFFDTPAIQFVNDIIVIKYLHENLSNIDVLLPTMDEECYEIYTKSFIDIDGSRGMLVDIWCTANRSFLYGRNLFPDNILNGVSKTLKVIEVDFIPYSHRGSVLGSETTLLVEYAKQYNFNISFSQVNVWGYIYNNWSGIGLFGEIVSDNQDVGIGAVFPLLKWLLFVDFSDYTGYFKITCIVPIIRDSLYMFLEVFSLEIWLLISISYLCGAIIINLLDCRWFSDNINIGSDRILVIFASSTDLAITNSRLSSRITFIVIFILKLYVTSMYNSQLSSTLVTPHYVATIETAEDLAYSDIPWGERQENWIYPIELDDSPVYKILTKKYQAHSMESLTELFKRGSFAFGVTRLNDGYILGDYTNEDNIVDYALMKDDIYHMYSGCVLRKSSVLTPSLDIFLSYAKQGGLIQLWESQAAREYFNTKIQMSLMSKDKLSATKALTISDVEGAFLLFIFGIILAISILLVEIIYCRLKKSQMNILN